MTSLILILVYFLVAVDGAAYPAPTLAARLDKRQGFDVATLWSPFIVGTTVSYGIFGYDDFSWTVTTLGNNWNWCSIGILDCFVMTTCELGTIFYPGTSAVCPSTEICGTEYLYSTLGANFDLTRFACYGTTSNTETFLLVSPTVGPILTTTSPITSTPSPTTSTPSPATSTPSLPGPTFPTPTPTSTPSKTPIGAIVGGVVGGLAVLALAALAILLLLRRRNQQPAPASEIQYLQQPPPPVAPYNPKYASYASSSPPALNTPLPMYQNTAGQNEVSYTSPGVPPTQQPTNTADSYARNLAPSPEGTDMPTATYWPQDSNTQSSTLPGLIELSAMQRRG